MGPKPQYTRKEIKGPRIIAAKYNTSCVKADQYPEGDTVEVAFLGRSNVGKSSLINSLCNYRGLALVTKVDKLNAKEKSINLAKVKAMYPTDSPPIMYSSLKHTGRELLQQRINQVLVGEEA